MTHEELMAGWDTIVRQMDEHTERMNIIRAKVREKIAVDTEELEGIVRAHARTMRLTPQQLRRIKMSENQREIWEERIAASQSEEDTQVLVAQYLYELGIVPQVFL